MVYNRGKQHVIKTGADNIVFRAMLVDGSHVEEPDNDFVNDISANEISVGSYARQTLTGVVVNIDDTGNEMEIIADDIAWGSLAAGATPAFVVIYAQIGGDDTTPGDDVLISSHSFTPTPTNGQPYTTTIPADGFIGG